MSPPSNLRFGDHVLNAAVGIRLTIYSKQTEEDEAREEGAGSPLHVYTYGQRLHFMAKGYRLPRNYRNPGAMDMAGYLASQGIRPGRRAHPRVAHRRRRRNRCWPAPAAGCARCA